MVALSNQSPFISETDYLEAERLSAVKHDYFNGEIVAMAGASREHVLICNNIITRLNLQVADRECEVYNSDMRVKVAESRTYVYPDVSVVCGEARFSDGNLDILLNPTLVIEVLSPSTERDDRGRKFYNYRKLENLQEYYLVSQDSVRIERYQRQAQDKTWLFTVIEGLDASITLDSIGCELKLAEVYQKIKFSSTNDNEGE